MNIVSVPAPGKAANRNAPMVAYSRIHLYACVKHRHLLHRSHNDDASLEPLAHEILVLPPPIPNLRRRTADEFNGEADKFICEQAAADEARVAMVEITNGDGSSRPEVVVNFKIKQATSAGVGMALQVSANPVMAIPQTIREQAAH